MKEQKLHASIQMIKSAPRSTLRMWEVRIFYAFFISIANNFAYLFDTFLPSEMVSQLVVPFYFLQRSASIFNRITSKYLSSWQKINSFPCIHPKSVHRIFAMYFWLEPNNKKCIIIMRFRVSVSYNFEHTMTKMIDKCFLHRTKPLGWLFLPCTSRIFCALCCH